MLLIHCRDAKKTVVIPIALLKNNVRKFKSKAMRHVLILQIVFEA